jgi:glycosyltransferase involved in cell wall biosynthesis
MVFNLLITFFTFIFFLRLKRGQKYIFQCRSEIGCSIVLSLRKRFYKRIKIICDSRGLGSKELLYKLRGHSKLKTPWLLERIENTARKDSDWIFCVSRSFKDYIAINNKIDPGKIEVIPCCVDTEIFKYVTKQRNIIRDELGIGGRFTVLYSGSLNEWQLPEQMISIFKSIREKIDDSIFLIITTSAGQAEELLYWSGLDRDSYRIISVPFTKISKYLMAGDIGLLIRENNEVNEVAFPIKLFEYIRCGVPVLTSITSDARKIISDYDAGFLLNDHNDMKETRDIVRSIFEKVKVIRSDEYKAGISKKIKSIADWDSYSGHVMEIYDKLMF